MRGSNTFCSNFLGGCRRAFRFTSLCAIIVLLMAIIILLFRVAGRKVKEVFEEYALSDGIAGSNHQASESRRKECTRMLGGCHLPFCQRRNSYVGFTDTLRPVVESNQAG